MRNPLVDRYLKQQAAWSPLTGSDDYNGRTYGTPTTINVRWYDEQNMIHTNDETEVLSRAHISAVEAINTGDRITDPEGRQREVLTVRINRDTRGNYSHRTAYLN